MSLAAPRRFNWRYSKATYLATRRQRFDIIHHVLPFAISTTYNLSWILQQQNGPKLVLGPVQHPLEISDAELVSRIDANLGRSIKAALRPALSRLSSQTIRRADRIIAVSKPARDLLQAGGARADQIETIPPGIDVGRFEYVHMDRKSSDRVELLAVGHLLKRKATDFIIKAMLELARARLNVHLTIAGDGPQRHLIQRMVADLQLESYVDLVGAVPNSEIHEYYKRAHIFVNMSRSESFSVVCLEAMASGLAIVATRVGGFEDAIRKRNQWVSGE